ncbi:glycosyltransferase family A protein [Shimia thalassica]|uniref:glycosyltransferase family 2 protein n=1 Tax=Shimia thalassica TaxID=1715693 RepID=UPI002734D465|nr:glycosyltransferase family A protein [Shimia thalassica]MDP2493671.1 glycosyltransferase family A protein [Shimia thalassica]
MARVTVVVATYNRATVLSRTLRTLIAQSLQDWQAVVVGDACSDNTQDVIAALDDKRIQFVNLPERFGEQAGPNSVGMALASTPYVAFLNHDDYWLTNHLELALSSLEQGEADMYWAQAAFFTNRGQWKDRVLFCEVSKPDRSFHDLLAQKFFVAEPLSSWVSTKEALNRLGPMQLASETVLAPIVDYCMRAARLGLTVVNGQETTVLKDLVLYPSPAYENPADYAEEWVRSFEDGNTTAVLDQVEEDLWLARALNLERDTIHPSEVRENVSRADVFRETGINLAEMQTVAQNTPFLLLERTLVHRTQETIRTQPSISDMTRYARDIFTWTP